MTAEEKTKKPHAVYRFPSLWGTPKYFRFYIIAYLYGFYRNVIDWHYVYEYENLLTGEYKVNWL